MLPSSLISLSCHNYSKTIGEWSHNDIYQDPQCLWVHPIKSDILLYVQSTKMFSKLIHFLQK